MNSVLVVGIPSYGGDDVGYNNIRIGRQDISVCYYIYGSVLARIHFPGLWHCPVRNRQRRLSVLRSRHLLVVFLIDYQRWPQRLLPSVHRQRSPVAMQDLSHKCLRCMKCPLMLGPLIRSLTMKILEFSWNIGLMTQENIQIKHKKIPLLFSNGIF